jgi:RNA polymerase sigma-70 factor (ECF subfamily)
VTSEPVAADDHLVSLSKDGNLEAFNRLVERHQASVYNLCLRMTGSRQAAEDTTQEAFIAAYRAIGGFRGGNFRSWLLRIAANRVKDDLRRHHRRRPPDSLDELSAAEQAPLQLADPNPGPEHRAEGAALSRIVEAALAELPEDQRLAVVLADLQELDYAEIAEVTGWALGTVKSRINRGRARLRIHFTRHPELLAGYRRLDT